MKSQKFIVRCFAALFIVPSILCSQSTVKVHGTVFDDSTGYPITGAYVEIEGMGIAAATDYSGQFMIENLLEGVYTVSASHVGYEKQQHSNVRVPKDRSTQLFFRLTPRLIALPAVQVMAPRSANTSPNAVWSISHETISRRNAANVAELIRLAPGIDVQDAGGAAGSKKISIRGSQTNQVLVMVDGIPLNDPLSGEADLANIPVPIIEKIEIHKGGAASLFGSGAIGGVVHITTRRSLQNEFKLNSTVGAFQTMTAEPVISGRFRRLGYFISYQYSTSQGDFPYQYVDSRQLTINEQRKNADALSRNLFGRLSFGPLNHNVALHFQRLLSDRGFPGKIDGWTPYARTAYTQSLLGLDYEYKQPAWTLTVNSSWSGATTANHNVYPPNVALRYKRYPPYHYQYRVNTVLSAVTLSFSLAKPLKMSIGYVNRHLQYRDKNYYLLDSPIEKAADHTNGVFFRQEWSSPLPGVSGRFIFSPAVRYDRIAIAGKALERIDDQWSPSCSAQLAFGSASRLYIRALAAKSFRAPTFADLFYQDVRVAGKPDLLPEKSRNTECSIGWQFSHAGFLRAEITSFHYSVDNLIVWRLGSFEVFSPYNNDADISGQEYLFSAQTPHDLLSLEMSYSHIKPLNRLHNQTTYNRILPYRAQHLFKAALRTIYKHIHAELTCTYIGKRYVNEANTQAIDGYLLWDAGLNWQQSFGRLSVTPKLSMLNFLDERYTIIRDMPLPGREWRFGLALSY